MRPTVLVTGEEGFKKGLFHFVVHRGYGEGIAAAGGLPLLALSPRDTKEYLAMADGLLLTGGKDLHASFYGGLYPSAPPPTAREREQLETFLCEAFLEAKKPIFAIGRGLAVLNTVLGGTLYQEISDVKGALCHRGERISDEGYESVFHKIKVEPKSRLFSLLGEEREVSSLHHTAVKTLGEGLRVAARSEDGIVEAVEHGTLPVFAVQWHPEAFPADGGEALFGEFVRLCREVKE